MGVLTITFIGAVLEKFNEPLKLVELREPDTLEPGQVWVRFDPDGDTANISDAIEFTVDRILGFGV